MHSSSDSRQTEKVIEESRDRFRSCHSPVTHPHPQPLSRGERGAICLSGLSLALGPRPSPLGLLSVPPCLRGLVILLLLVSTAAADPIDFDRQVAPLLATRCLECHDGTDPKGKLDLSEHALLTKGGESGPVLIDNKLDDSPLWQRVRDDEMPPKHPLSAEDKAVLKAWIEQGAKWGSGPIDPYRFSSDRRAGYDWWSLKSLPRTPPPAVPAEWQGRVNNPIDQYVLAALKEQGLSPSEPAEPRQLVRRLALDLTGLPPTPEEVRAFEQAPTSEAYEALITKWLSSPQYGERWARHWLDLARFGESQGFERDKLRTNSWPYRDWVIQALNTDMPYDEFVRMQIAGDLLHPDDANAITATGFLVAAPYDEVGQSQQSAAMRAVVRQDELEDLVGTVGQTFLGLTANCARCHDHKFDPISQAEYYQLAACLDGVRHGERKILTKPMREELDANLARQKSATEEIDAIEKPAKQKVRQSRTDGTKPPAPTPLARWDFDKDLSDQIGDLDGSPRAGASLQAGKLVVDGQSGFVTTTPIPVRLKAKTLEAWVQLAKLDQAGGGVMGVQTTDGVRFDSIVFGEREAKRWMAGSEGFVRYQSFQGPEETEAASRTMHVAITYAEDGTITCYRDGKPYGTAYDSGEPAVYEPGTAQVVFGLRHGTEPGGNRLLTGAIDSAQLYDRALTADEVAASAGRTDIVTTEELLAALSDAERTRREALLAERTSLRAREKQLRETSVYACAPRPPGVTKILARGNPATPTDVVTPRALTAVAQLSADFGLAPEASDAERRVALARWITSPQNPLFARVIVNRVWQYHFGVGLVDSSNDFGFNGGRPTHPELLDYLAQSLINSGWSLKQLHRLIVTSNTWKQSSRPRTECLKIDADNRWLWRMRPHRLEAETIRDLALAVSGTLNPQVGGPPYQDFKTFNFNSQFFEMIDPETPDAHRRTIYRTWIRSGRSSLLDALDCPDPSTTAPRRAVTTTPVQSLALLNNSFMLRMADALAARLEREVPGDRRGQIDRLFWLAYSRGLSEPESGQLIEFTSQHGLPALCRAVLNSNEFVFAE
jgi:hypothetical protein